MWGEWGRCMASGSRPACPPADGAHPIRAQCVQGETDFESRSSIPLPCCCAGLPRRRGAAAPTAAPRPEAARRAAGERAWDR